MVWLLASLLLAGVVTPVVSQYLPLGPECSRFTDVNANYMTSNSQCCSNYVLTALLRLCCTDGETCRCSPQTAITCPLTTTTSITATTTTTVPTTTTTLPPGTKLCPGSTTTDSPKPAGRLLNSVLVDSEECQGGATVGFIAGNNKQVCNGAYYDKEPLTGIVVLSTLTSCWDQKPTMGQIGKEILPLDDCSVKIASPVSNLPGMTLVVLSPLASFFVDKQLESCTNRGCLYNLQNMSTAIDWRNCFIASYGASTIGGEGDKLNVVPVMLADTTQCKDAPANSQCFVSTTGTACLTDNGAPLFCPLSTGERVYYGLTTVNSCMPGYTAFNVLPVSGMDTQGPDVPVPLP